MTDGTFDGRVSIDVDTGDRISVRRRYGRRDEYVVTREHGFADVELSPFTPDPVGPAEAMRRVQTSVDDALASVFTRLDELTATLDYDPATYPGSALAEIDAASNAIARAKQALREALDAAVRPLQRQRVEIAVEYVR